MILLVLYICMRTIYKQRSASNRIKGDESSQRMMNATHFSFAAQAVAHLHNIVCTTSTKVLCVCARLYAIQSVVIQYDQASVHFCFISVQCTSNGADVRAVLHIANIILQNFAEHFTENHTSRNDKSSDSIS